jgi:putative ABC transport system ATP-binding protein
MQADPTLDRARGGLGLGLTLVKGLAELHGGSVSARSDGPGLGAEFTVRLPLAVAPGETVDRREARPAQPRRVLIIEDNLEAAVSFKEALGLDGHDVAHLSDDELAEVRNKKIGFVFQQFNLLPRATALENIEVPLFYRGDPTPRPKAEKALERVGLGHRMDHYPNQLSGGQRQRVAIARALVNDPSIVLADEPTGNLDSKTSVEIMTFFRELNAQGVTLIIVTHEPDIAAWCSRSINIRDGKIVSDESQPAHA